jgi:hypothetical protein
LQIVKGKIVLHQCNQFKEQEKRGMDFSSRLKMFEGFGIYGNLLA